MPTLTQHLKTVQRRMLLNRFLVTWLVSRAIRRSYNDDLQRVLYSKEHQVKGRFD